MPENGGYQAAGAGLAAPHQWKLAPLRLRSRGANFRLYSPGTRPGFILAPKALYRRLPASQGGLLIRKGALFVHYGALLRKYSAPSASGRALLPQKGAFSPCDGALEVDMAPPQ